MKPQVICLPGGVAPAAQRYAPLVEALDGAAEIRSKDLEVYRDDAPPEAYAIELELAAVDQLAGSLGLDRFHLVGYSGAGSSHSPTPECGRAGCSASPCSNLRGCRAS
jgi:hypothetical protein